MNREKLLVYIAAICSVCITPVLYFSNLKTKPVQYSEVVVQNSNIPTTTSTPSPTLVPTTVATPTPTPLPPKPNPTKQVVNEKNENGKFFIENPEVDNKLVEGKTHFDYRFNFDHTARKILEKGFTHKINANICKDWIDVKDWFEYTWKAGSLGREEYDESVGIGVNINDDAFDKNEPYTTKSTYSIYDRNGKQLFSGYVQVPNCKKK